MSIENNLKRIADALEKIAIAYGDAGSTPSPDEELEKSPGLTITSEPISPAEQAMKEQLVEQATPEPIIPEEMIHIPVQEIPASEIITPQMLNDLSAEKAQALGDGTPIRKLLTELKATSLNDLDPAMYPIFKARVEAL